MTDPIYRAFLETVKEDAAKINAESDILRLVASRDGGGPPSKYQGIFTDVQYLVRSGDGTIRHSLDPILFGLNFPADYLRSIDPDLQFRVAGVYVPLYHPNIRKGLVCLGPGFACGTRLRPLVEQIYAIFSARVHATDHAFDSEARHYYLTHVDEIRALRSAPLWRRPVALRVDVKVAEVQAAGGDAWESSS